MAATTTAVKKKFDLIESILGIIFPVDEIQYLQEDNPQKMSFNIKVHNTDVMIKHFIVWNNNLDIEIWITTKISTSRLYISSATWFKVRDLLRKRFLDAEKLKWEIEKCPGN